MKVILYFKRLFHVGIISKLELNKCRIMQSDLFNAYVKLLVKE
jgi:hypothetical protein